MRHGLRTWLPTGKIDYKQLRKINPEAARQAVVEYLKTNNHNVSEAAFIFGINRAVVALCQMLWKQLRDGTNPRSIFLQ